MTSQIYKKKFSTKVDETLHFRRLQDSYKRNNFGVNHYISGHVISQIMEFMTILVDLSAIFKDRDFWFGPEIL